MIATAGNVPEMKCINVHTCRPLAAGQPLGAEKVIQIRFINRRSIETIPLKPLTANHHGTVKLRLGCIVQYHVRSYSVSYKIAEEA